MRRHLTRPAVLTAAAVLAVTGPAIIPSPAAYASTQCVAGQNAGYSNGGSGSVFWGWCHPNGGSVRFKLSLICASDGNGWDSDWASGSGYGAVYTDGHDCGYGGIAAFEIING